MDEGHESSNRNWWSIFLKAKYPAYATLVEPSSIRGLDVKAARCRVKVILVDDVLDPAVHKKSGDQSPTQFEIREGSFVLALPDDAEPDRVMVSAPWLCLVNKISLIPDGDSYKQPSGTTADVQEWERQQIRQGRISVANFQLAVTYFYRWSDYFKSVVKDNNNLERLTTAFRRLGVAKNRADTLALLEKRGCGNAPPTQFGMRYVMYSNHQTGDPPGSDDEDDDVGDEGSDEPDDPPVPLESIVGVAKVLFLGSNDSLPHHKATPAEVSTVQSTIPDYRTLPPNGKTAVAQQAAAARQLPPGFVCNMFLEVRSSGVVKPRLYGLQEWAEGRAGTNFKQPWVEGSRAQVRQLLAVTKNELSQYNTTPRRQQQQPMWNDGAGTSAAAAAGDSSGEYLDAQSNSADTSEGQERDDNPDDSDDLAQGPGQRLAEAAAAGSAGRRQQKTPAQQQQQQQRHTPRKVVGLDDSSSSEQISSSSDDVESDDNEGGQDELDLEQQQQVAEQQEEKQLQQSDDDDDQGTSDGSDDIQIVDDGPAAAAASSDCEQQQQQDDDQDDDGNTDDRKVSSDKVDSSEDHDSSGTSSSSDGRESDRDQQQQAVHVSRARQRDSKVLKATAAAAAAAAAPTGRTMSVPAAGTPAGIKRKRPATSTPQPAAAAGGGMAVSSSEVDGSENDVEHCLSSRDRAAAAAGGRKRRKQQHSKPAAAAAAAGDGGKNVRERQTSGSRGHTSSAGRQQQRHTP